MDTSFRNGIWNHILEEFIRKEESIPITKANYKNIERVTIYNIM
jgi:hypothetical protein